MISSSTLSHICSTFSHTGLSVQNIYDNILLEVLAVNINLFNWIVSSTAVYHMKYIVSVSPPILIVKIVIFGCPNYANFLDLVLSYFTFYIVTYMERAYIT